MFDYIAPIFTRLYEETGINFIVFYDRFEYDRMLRGMELTLLLALCCLILSIIIGVLGTWAQESRYRIVRSVVTAYVQLFRNTPPFVQMLFFYFALGQYTPDVSYGTYTLPMISAFGWAVISLGCFGGAFNVEIFRAGLSAVPQATTEGAEALGYTRTQTFFYVTLPLAIRFAWPALTGNLISLLKTTSLAYVISVPEMTQVANQIWSDNVNVPEMMIVLFVFYNVIVAIFSAAMRLVERALAIPGYA